MASRKSKGPNGERGGRLMKAMMCEANRKEDRMCGKQMERRQPWGRAQSAALAAQWLCLKSPETPGIVGMSVPCLRASHSTRKGRILRLGAVLAVPPLLLAVVLVKSLRTCSPPPSKAGWAPRHLTFGVRIAELALLH